MLSELLPNLRRSAFSALIAIVCFPVTISAQTTGPTAPDEEYGAYIAAIPDRIMRTAADICGRGKPTEALLTREGFTERSAGLWHSGAIRVSFGPGLGGDSQYHCIISAVSPRDRPADVDDVFVTAMARTLTGRFNGDPTNTLTITKRPLNYVFEVTNTKTGAWQSDGAIVPPSPELRNDIGGLLINMP
jgi:hypothetical protein